MPVPVGCKPRPGCGNPQPARFGPERSRSIDLEWSLSAVRVVERTYEGAARVEGLLLGPLHEEEVDDPVADPTRPGGRVDTVVDLQVHRRHSEQDRKSKRLNSSH